ncbi:TPA: acetamidase [Candidatus Bathyarchaeota archaeon]|nr:acetamidase [Candidatus Bathyarchaeota archaeon]
MVKRIPKIPFERLTPSGTSTLSPFNKPIARVKPGEEVEIETWDAFGGCVTETQTRKQTLDKGVKVPVNPVTGPIHIEGAEPSDTLTVEILDIDLPDHGATTISPGFGGLEGWLNFMTPRTKISQIKAGKVFYKTDGGRVVEVPVDPFIGTIGNSPVYEAINTLTPGPHGGNMDCPDIRPGNILHLPVNQPGALFGLGDVHAVQGDGEVGGSAIEVPAVVKLRFGLKKGYTIAWPRVESPDEIMTVCSAKPLEDAARLAYRELVNWMATDHGWQRDDAYMFLSIAAKARIAQIVDPLYTVVAKLPKKYLKK